MQCSPSPNVSAAGTLLLAVKHWVRLRIFSLCRTCRGSRRGVDHEGDHKQLRPDAIFVCAREHGLFTAPGAVRHRAVADPWSNPIDFPAIVSVRGLLTGKHTAHLTLTVASLHAVLPILKTTPAGDHSRQFGGIAQKRLAQGRLVCCLRCSKRGNGVCSRHLYRVCSTDLAPADSGHHGSRRRYHHGEKLCPRFFFHGACFALLPSDTLQSVPGAVRIRLGDCFVVVAVARASP